MRTELPPQKKGAQSPNFPSMPIVTKRSPISATAEHLLFLLTVVVVVVLTALNHFTLVRKLHQILLRIEPNFPSVETTNNLTRQS